ncbi:hypothetical protein E2C01_053382 [Portunus trituberculatus]|uniref:Uncharacterized protein n=1 Tax=Portunus trituberculatus TaxID=210409 RepID=A0A5B7GRW8_PORTR|nr:hypothetical protein [Portunus trituberculatus]
MAWLPQLNASGLRLVVPLVPNTLRQLHLLQFCPLLLQRREVPFALKDSSVATLGAVGDLTRDAAEVPLQVGACLQRHWLEWENIRACKWVVKTFRYGYVLPFLRETSLSSAPVEFPVYREGLDRHLALEAAISEMLVELVVDPQAGFYSHVFLVPKTTKGWRLICDLLVLNLSAGQGSTSIPLEVFAGTSCIPSMVSARWAPADVGSAVVPKEVLASCFQPRLVAGGTKSKSGGTHSEPLSALGGTVLRWCKSHSISLCPVFVPGCRNVIVDVLSRECVRSGSLATECVLFSVGRSGSVRLSTICSDPLCSGIDLSTNPDLSSLFRSFVISCPPRSPRLPAWDLSLVTQSLLRSPHEPLRAALLREVSLRPCFFWCSLELIRLVDFTACQLRCVTSKVGHP